MREDGTGPGRAVGSHNKAGQAGRTGATDREGDGVSRDAWRADWSRDPTRATATQQQHWL